MARHYYDLWCLISRGVAEKAAVEEELFNRVAIEVDIGILVTELRPVDRRTERHDAGCLVKGPRALKDVELDALGRDPSFGAREHHVAFGHEAKMGLREDVDNVREKTQLLMPICQS